MPESNLSQTSMRELVHDAESQIESLSRALDNLKSTVRRLSAQVAMTEGASPATGSGYGFGSLSPQSSPAAPEEKPFDFSAAAAALSQDLAGNSPVISHQRPLPPSPEPAARTDSEWYGVSDGGSWPVGPKHADAPGPQPVDPSSPSTEVQFVDNLASEAAEVVAAAEDPAGATAWSEWDLVRPTPQDATSTGATDGAEAVFDANDLPAASQPSEQPKRSLSSGWPDEGIWSQSFDWPAMRGSTPTGPSDDAGPPKDDFRSMVDQVRAEIEAARANGETMDIDFPGEADTDDEEARRAEVQRTVEEMRTRTTVDDEEAYAGSDFHFDVQDSEADPTALDDDEAKREEARRAVEQMRAEMAGASSVSFAAPSTPPPSLDWSHMKAENSGPPVLVVKDGDGRVELANVYDLLSRLECGESAALLNYTPHSVTIGLPIQAPVPVLEAVETAVMAVFGRGGVVDTDGARITVQMGTDIKKKRSEDAA
jgi:hypothetical protein